MDKTLDVINRLIQLDIDALLAYSQAVKNIDHPQVKQELMSFMRDHDRHIDELSEQVRQLGGTPPSRKRDIKGVLIENFTALRSRTGTAGALRAMRMNEGLTNRMYENAIKAELPSHIKDVVLKNREDERRHLRYIEQAIEKRVWDTEQRQAV